MFTGIIEALGTVKRVDRTPRHGGATAAHRLTVDMGRLAEGLVHGASVAVNGACLTVAEQNGGQIGFDVIPETWRRSNLQFLRPDQKVHLERSLRAGDPIDGHFVQGHVDGVGHVDRVDRDGGEWKLWLRCPAELMPYVVPKGAVALDGTSLTLVDVTRDRFSVALVPTTLESTLLGQRQPGDAINIETDILARLVLTRLEQLLGRGETHAPLTLEKLRAGGFVS